MGVARSLFQASEDRLLPRFFMHQNKHHVPDRAMIFNVICAMLVGLFGSPVRIYIFSNVGYIVAVAGSLYGYFLIDVEMCPCMLTSRIVQASAAVQLFVQRCLLNLESVKQNGNEIGVSPSAFSDDDVQAWIGWRNNGCIFSTACPPR